MDNHITTVREDIERLEERIAGDVSDVRLALNETKDSMEGQIMELKLLLQEIQGEVETDGSAETISDVLEEPQFARGDIRSLTSVSEEDQLEVGGPRDVVI